MLYYTYMYSVCQTGIRGLIGWERMRLISWVCVWDSSQFCYTQSGVEVFQVWVDTLSCFGVMKCSNARIQYTRRSRRRNFIYQPFLVHCINSTTLYHTPTLLTTASNLTLTCIIDTTNYPGFHYSQPHRELDITCTTITNRLTNSRTCTTAHTLPFRFN